MSQRREHRLRRLEKQYRELAAQLDTQYKKIEGVRGDIYWLQYRLYGNQLALPPVPWYKRLFRRPRK